MKTEKAQRYLQRCMLELPNGSVKDALREVHMAFNVLRAENAPDEKPSVEAPKRDWQTEIEVADDVMWNEHTRRGTVVAFVFETIGEEGTGGYGDATTYPRAVAATVGYTGWAGLTASSFAASTL